MKKELEINGQKFSKIQFCLNCGKRHELTAEDICTDELGVYTTCNDCESSFDIALSCFVSPNEREKLIDYLVNDSDFIAHATANFEGMDNPREFFGGWIDNYIFPEIDRFTIGVRFLDISYYVINNQTDNEIILNMDDIWEEFRNYEH